MKLLGSGASSHVASVAAEPRAQLLPPEVTARANGRRLVSRANLAVFIVLVAVLAATVLSAVYAIGAQNALQAEQNRTVSLLAEQAKYQELTKLKKEISTSQAAQRVGASGEINWKSFFAEVSATLPAGVTITSISAASGSPTEPFAVTGNPLSGESVASLTINAESAGIEGLRDWVAKLRDLPSYAGAMLVSATLVEGEVYRGVLTLDVSSEALEGRFLPEDADPEAEDTEPGAAATQEGEAK